MKLVLYFLTGAALFGQEMGEPTPNIERVDLDNYRDTYEKVLGDGAERGKADVKLALFELTDLPERYVEKWTVSADGTTYRVDYTDAEAGGGAAIHVRTLPFKTKLGLAPSAPREVSADGETMSLWHGQQWDVLHIPYLKGQVRCFYDQAAKDGNGELHSSEPFTINLADKKAVWIWISARYGDEGMTLEQALRAFKMTKK